MPRQGLRIIASWDFVVYSGGEGFVSDYYMNTGYANWIPGIDICT